MRKMQKAKRAKKAAKAADKAEDAGRLGKAAKLAKKGGKKAKKLASKNKRFLKYAAIAGAIGGGTMFLDKNTKTEIKRSKSVRVYAFPKTGTPLTKRR